MARGWESKSVEAQQEEAGQKTIQPRAHLSPDEAASQRAREGLRLARQRLLQQIHETSNERHRQLLEKALADLDRKLSQS